MKVNQSILYEQPLPDSDSNAQTNKAQILNALEKSLKISDALSSAVETELHDFVRRRMTGTNQSHQLNHESKTIDRDDDTLGKDSSSLKVKYAESDLVLQLEDSQKRLLSQLEETIRTLDANGGNDNKLQLPKEKIQQILF